MKAQTDPSAGLTIIPYDDWISRRITGGRDRYPDCRADQGHDRQSSLDRATLEAHQLERLNRTLIHAKARSRFYAQHLASCELPLTSLGQVASLPLLAPWQIREHGQAMLCVGQGQVSRIVSLSTSGTTGPAKRLFFTPDDHDLTLDIFRVSMLQVARTGESSYVLLPCSSPGGVGDLLLRAIAMTSARPQAHGPVSSLPELVGRLANEPSCSLVGIPAQIMALARYCQHMALALPVRSVLLCTDHVPDAICRAIGEIWHCQVYEYYGMTEACYAGGMECAAHAGCHLHEADLLVEIIDPASGQPLPEGEFGEVVITSLLRRGMPLVRYRTGDLSRLLPGQCPCGSVLRRLEKIRARKDCLIEIGPGGTDHLCQNLKGRRSEHDIFPFGAKQSTLSMAELDEALWPLPWLASFSACLKRGQGKRCQDKNRLCLALGGFGTIGQQNKDEMNRQVRLALSAIPSLDTGLKHGWLDLELEIHEHGDLIAQTAGKRQIKIN